MSLDIRFIARKPVVCPRCGETVAHEDICFAESGGRGWYPILESIGYYVPYDQRTEKNDWYGNDMELTEQQAEEVYRYIKQTPGLYNTTDVLGLIATSILEKNKLIVNADW